MHTDAATLAVIFHRVLEQVEKNLREAPGIQTSNHFALKGHFDQGAARLSHDGRVSRTLRHDVADIRGAEIELESM
jgi:hypothetical protein